MQTPRKLIAAVTAAFAILSISCNDSSPVAPAAPATSVADTVQPDASLLGSLLGPTGLLACTPQPYDSVTRIIGPDGGTIHVGNNWFHVPPGALSRRVAITAVAPSGPVNVVNFQPQGLQFERAATLTMSYANCGLIGRLLPRHIAYTNDNLRILELLPALDNLLRQTATARIKHFSGYAIAF